MAITFDLTKEFDPGLDAEETIFDKLPSTKESQLAMMQAGVRPDEPTKSYIPSKRSAFSEPSSLTDSPDVIVDSETLGTGNPLDDLQAPAPQPSQKEKASEETMGRIISRGFGYIEKLKDMKGARFGQKREVAVMKAMDDAAIARTYNIMQDHLRRNGYDDPNLLEDLAKHRGGGYRSAENIDRLFEIKSKGTMFQDEKGEVIVPPNEEWEKVIEADRISRAMSLKSQQAAGGGAEEITRWQGVMKNTLDAEGNVMPDRMGEYEKAASEIDRLTGAPTGVSKFANRYNSKQDRISKMTAAMDSGIPYKGLAAEQIPSEILKLNQETVELAVENAPYFGANDREAAAKWVTDPATKGLPFRSDYEGKKIPHFVTSEPGVYNIWSPKEKTWMVVDKRKPKPETATAAEPTDNSQFSEAGKTGQKIRRAAGKLSGVAESGLAKAGVAVADLLPLSVNTGAAVIEGAAGVFDSPLKLDRMDYMEERAKKNKVGKYRVK